MRSLETVGPYYYKFSPDSDSEKKFENGLIFDKVQAYKNCAKFLGAPYMKLSIRAVKSTAVRRRDQNNNGQFTPPDTTRLDR